MSEAIRSVRELRDMSARRSERPRAVLTGALVVLLACVACRGAVEIKSEREPSYAGHIRTLYLAMVQGGLSKDYANGFVDSFSREMGRRHVTLSSRVLAGTDVDRQMVYREVAASHADAALVVRPPHGVTTSGEAASLNWEVSLFDAKTGSTVWNAQVENKNADAITAGTVDDTSVRIAEQLDADHLLGDGS